MHRLQELVRLHRLRLPARQIARELGVGPNTERSYRRIFAAAGILDGDPHALPDLEELWAIVDAVSPRTPPKQETSTITKWQPRIQELLKGGARFTAPDLLIVDDLGLRPLQGDEPLDLYEIVRQRYERGSMIISSNRAIDEWGALFKDNLLASAAVDRLLHHAHVVVMEGDTYRNPPASRRPSAKPAIA